MKTRTIAATALLLLVLTGCAGTPETDPSETEQAGHTTTGQTPDETPEPLVAETPAAPEQTDAEAAYLKFLADHPRQGTLIPNATDEQRLAAGYEICAQLAEGKEGNEITVIEGETRNPDSGYYMDSFDMYSAAVTAGLCE